MQHFLQNGVEGQVLAVKVLATRGIGGKTIDGHYLEGKNGKDLPLRSILKRRRKQSDYHF